MKLPLLKYLEFVYLTLLLATLVIIPFNFSILQSICMMLIVAGVAIGGLGLVYLFSLAVVTTLDHIVLNNPEETKRYQTMTMNKIRSSVLNDVISELIILLMNKSDRKTDNNEKRYRHYVIYGLILLIFGIIITFILVKSNLI